MFSDIGKKGGINGVRGGKDLRSADWVTVSLLNGSNVLHLKRISYLSCFLRCSRGIITPWCSQGLMGIGVAFCLVIIWFLRKKEFNPHNFSGVIDATTTTYGKDERIHRFFLLIKSDLRERLQNSGTEGSEMGRLTLGRE